MTAAADIDVLFEALLDRTACLVPRVSSFTASGTWTKPAHALTVTFVLQNAGHKGGNGAAGSGGGGGGASGSHRELTLPASAVPSTLAVTVPIVVDGTRAKVADAVSGFEIICDGVYTGPDDATTGAGTVGGTCQGALVTHPEFSLAGASGGNGGAGGAPTGAPGTAGWRGITSPATAAGTAGTFGGATATGGKGGLGYGAGGGGGGGANGGGAGGGAGGGGGGGWGKQQLAADGADGTVRTGGAGAQGIVVVTTWCGVEV